MSYWFEQPHTLVLARSRIDGTAFSDAPYVRVAAGRSNLFPNQALRPTYFNQTARSAAMPLQGSLEAFD
jgi:hypothetical protein